MTDVYKVLEETTENMKRALAEINRLRALNRELLGVANIVIERGCGCYSNTKDDWHSDKCPIPKARAAIRKTKGE